MFGKKRVKPQIEDRYQTYQTYAERVADRAARWKETPEEQILRTGGSKGSTADYVKPLLQGAVDAARLANFGASGDLPDGWRSVDPPAALAKAYERAGATQLTSPEGISYVAFADHKPGRFEKLQQKLGIKTERTQAVFDIGRDLSNETHVTFTGIGRGGAMAKLASEAASSRLTENEGVESKLCVAINATAVAPKTYSTFGLASKMHERTTCHIVNEKDAYERLKGFTPQSSTAEQRELGWTNDELREVKQAATYRIEHRRHDNNERFVGGPRSGQERSVAEDLRLTVKGDLDLKNLFKDQVRANSGYAHPAEIDRDMKLALVRNYVKSQALNGPGLTRDASSRSDSSLSR